MLNERAFRIGSGRYLQGRGIVASAVDEILRLGENPLILSGETAWKVAGEAIRESLAKKGLSYTLKIHKGICNKDVASTFAAYAKENGHGVIVGVGGGVMMDLAKLVAVLASLPVLNIPTSAATCAAYTPLSVCYTEEGRTIGTAHHDVEVNCVLVDTEIMIGQPPRLFLSGVFDAMAKFLEIRHRYRPEDTSFSLGLDYAYVMSVRSFELLSAATSLCLDAMKRGEITETFEQAIFTLIAATGVISGIARGSNQTALGHKFYESARALYPAQTKPYLHGELVGVGLLLQNEYNGERKRNDELLSFMKKHGMPYSPLTSGIPADAKEIMQEKMMNSSAMKGATAEGEERLLSSLSYLWRL